MAYGWHLLRGLGRIVYAASGAQLVAWRAGWGIPAGPVAALPITDVVPGAVVDGPVASFEDELRELHHRRF